MVAELVRRAQDGDAEAFSQLVRDFQDAVYATAYQLVLDADSARDLAQEAFVRAYQVLGTLRQPEAFPAWLVRICRNLATDWLRRPERQWQPLDETTPAAADVAATVAVRDLVHRALATLPADNRLALSLFLVNGYTYQEVATLTGASLSTVKGRIERAKGKLATEVLSMVEGTLKSDAPDEAFTVETLRRSLEEGFAAMQAKEPDRARALAEQALTALAEAPVDPEQRRDLRIEALGLLGYVTVFRDPDRWREAARELVALAEAKGNVGLLSQWLFDLALRDHTLGDTEREALYERVLGLYRSAGLNWGLGQALFFRGWHSLTAGAIDRGLAQLQEAREALAEVPYTDMHACLEASAEFERLAGGKLDLARGVRWGAACNRFRVEGERLLHDGQPGFVWSEGDHGDTTKGVSPFHHLFSFVEWFPHSGPQPGFTETRAGFSYTPHASEVRAWIESDSNTIATPAARFTDCLLLRVSQTESPLDADVESQERTNNRVWCGEKWCWFARGVGPVACRFERADGIVQDAVLARFECPEPREEWVPLVVGTRWEYVPATPAPDLETVVVEQLRHVDDKGRYYLAHTTFSQRRED